MSDYKRCSRQASAGPEVTGIVLVTYDHHTPRHPDPIPCRRVAYLALQHELGLRPQWRGKRAPLGLSRSVADWPGLAAAENIYWHARA